MFTALDRPFYAVWSNVQDVFHLDCALYTVNFEHWQHLVIAKHTNSGMACASMNNVLLWFNSTPFIGTCSSMFHFRERIPAGKTKVHVAELYTRVMLLLLLPSGTVKTWSVSPFPVSILYYCVCVQHFCSGTISRIIYFTNQSLFSHHQWQVYHSEGNSVSRVTHWNKYYCGLRFLSHPFTCTRFQTK